MYRYVLFALIACLSSCSFKSQESKMWVVILQAQEAQLAKNMLILKGVSDTAGAFTKEGKREAVAMHTSWIVKTWHQRFKTERASASLAYIVGDGKSQQLLMRLSKPLFENGQLRFEIEQMSTPAEGTFKEVVLIIDGMKCCYSCEDNVCECHCGKGD